MKEPQEYAKFYPHQPFLWHVELGEAGWQPSQNITQERHIQSDIYSGQICKVAQELLDRLDTDILCWIVNIHAVE